MSLPDFAALNERRAEAGLSTFMNPRNAAAGTIRQLDPKLAAERPLSMWAYAIGRVEGLRFTRHSEALEWLTRARLPRSTATSSVLDDERAGRRAVPGVGAPARRAGLRDRRRRRQGRRPRAAAPARRGRPRPALGGRVEVPADDEGLDAAADPLERRQVRRPAPVRRARAGPRRRRDREDGDAAQRGGPAAQGHPRGRRGHRHARRRRHPADHLAGAARGRAPGPLAAARAAGALPVVRHADGQARGLGVHAAARTALCPARRWQLLKHFASEGAMDIEGLGEKQVDVAPARGPRARPRATSTGLTPEQLVEVDRIGETSAQPPRRAHPGARRSGRSAACCSAMGIEGVGGVTGRNLAQRFRSIDALLDAIARGDRRDAGHRAEGRRSSSTSSSATRTCARWSRTSRSSGCSMEAEGAAARRGPAERARRSSSPARCPTSRASRRPSASSPPAGA